MIARTSRILAQAEYEGTRYILQDRGGVYAVGPVWGLGRVFRSEKEAWMRFHEATGGVALEITEENMNEPDRFIERVVMSVEAGEHLEHAKEACEKAEQSAERGFYLGAALAARDAEEEAARAGKLLMAAFMQEADATIPEPSEEEKAEIEAEMVRIMASEDLLEACEEACRIIAVYGHPEDDNNVFKPIFDQLQAAIEKARPA